MRTVAEWIGCVTGRWGTAKSVAWRRATLLAALAASAGTLTLPGSALPASATPVSARYIVSDLGAANASVAGSLVAAAGGHVAANLDVAGAVSADLTPDQVAAIGSAPGVQVTPDVTVSVQDTTATSGTSRAPAAVFPQTTNATQAWSQGDTGAGVNVAVLDTGIDPLPDLAGRLTAGVDLSGEGNSLQDSYGHGTFMAGLIAGNGASSGGAYLGEAPGAGLVSVKVAGGSGQTDLATVIAGVNWAVKNQSRLSIGVLNMSLGYIPTQSTVTNPLDQAVENAWKSGIVVVASAGNYGPFNGTILSPGDDPLVITVGALDDMGTAIPSDDTMTTFSSVGPTQPDGWLKPDLVASGRSVVSLRAPGSTIDTTYPSARIGAANFVGSGTSASAAITSGAAALVLAGSGVSHSPNNVKAALLGSTMPGPVGNPFVDGHGALNAAGAITIGQVRLMQPTPQVAAPVGGTVSLTTTWGVSSWNPANWNGLAWNGLAWNGLAWNGLAWNGLAWNGLAWNGLAWNGLAWN